MPERLECVVLPKECYIRYMQIHLPIVIMEGDVSNGAISNDLE